MTQQKNEAEAKAKEEENKLREEKEKERQKIRDSYVREWDIGKDGSKDKKRFREMSQEEYVESQRSKRNKEFAPPSTITSSKSDYTFDGKGSKVETTETPMPSTSWAEVRPKQRTPSPPNLSDYVEQKGLYFSTAKTRLEPKLLYTNFVRAQEPTLIVNELDVNSVEVNDENSERPSDENYTVIPPPPTYDYYGPQPVRSQQREQNSFQSDLREAYEQGVRSLNKGPSRRKLSELYDFAMD